MAVLLLESNLECRNLTYYISCRPSSKNRSDLTTSPFGTAFLLFIRRLNEISTAEIFMETRDRL